MSARSLGVLGFLLLIQTLSVEAKSQSEAVRISRQYRKCLELLKSTDPGPGIHHQLFFRADTHLGIVVREDEKASKYAALFFAEDGNQGGIKRFPLPRSKAEKYDLSPKGFLDKESVLHFGPSYPPESVTISMGMGNVPPQADAKIEAIDLSDNKPGSPSWVLRTFLTDFFKDNAYAWDSEVHEVCSEIGDPLLRKLLVEVEKKKKG